MSLAQTEATISLIEIMNIGISFQNEASTIDDPRVCAGEPFGIGGRGRGTQANAECEQEQEDDGSATP